VRGSAFSHRRARAIRSVAKDEKEVHTCCSLLARLLLDGCSTANTDLLRPRFPPRTVFSASESIEGSTDSPTSGCTAPALRLLPPALQSMGSLFLAFVIHAMIHDGYAHVGASFVTKYSIYKTVLLLQPVSTDPYYNCTSFLDTLCLDGFRTA
jgi:hypothetical protein